MVLEDWETIEREFKLLVFSVDLEMEVAGGAPIISSVIALSVRFFLLFFVVLLLFLTLDYI